MTYRWCEGIQDASISKAKDEHANDYTCSNCDIGTPTSFKTSPRNHSDEPARDDKGVCQEERFPPTDAVKPWRKCKDSEYNPGTPYTNHDEHQNRTKAGDAVNNDLVILQWDDAGQLK
jgi:hypothetical protein